MLFQQLLYFNVYLSGLWVLVTTCLMIHRKSDDEVALAMLAIWLLAEPTRLCVCGVSYIGTPLAPDNPKPKLDSHTRSPGNNKRRYSGYAGNLQEKVSANKEWYIEI